MDAECDKGRWHRLSLPQGSYQRQQASKSLNHGRLFWRSPALELFTCKCRYEDTDDMHGALYTLQNFKSACESKGQAVKLRMQPGYDHSYFFIATFIAEHIAFHAKCMA